MRKFISILFASLLVCSSVNVSAISNNVVDLEYPIYDVDDYDIDVNLADRYYNAGKQALTDLDIIRFGLTKNSIQLSIEPDYIPPVTLIYQIAISGLGSYTQNGESWSSSNMESCDLTIGSAGCAVTSFANNLNKYQTGYDPGEINTSLGSHACPFDYSYSAAYYNLEYDNIFHSSSTTYDKTIAQALPTLFGILQDGYAPMIGLRNGSATHFVVVSGYKEYSDGSFVLEIVDTLESPTYTSLIAYFTAGYKVHRIKVFYE